MSAAMPAAKMVPECDPFARPDWARLVEKLRGEDASGMDDLYRVFGDGVAFLLRRQSGSAHLEERVRDTLRLAAQAVRAGELQEPERLVGLVRAIVRRSPVVESAVPARDSQIATQILDRYSPRDREILIRFYLQEDSSRTASDPQLPRLKSEARAAYFSFR